MRPDLKYICDEWIRRGRSMVVAREIDCSNCLFNEGEFILVIVQSKKHPVHDELAPVSVMRVFHTSSQNKRNVNSNEDILKLIKLFKGLDEDFEFLYNKLAHMSSIRYRRDAN